MISLGFLTFWRSLASNSFDTLLQRNPYLYQYALHFATHQIMRHSHAFCFAITVDRLHDIHCSYGTFIHHH
ncbi:MAG: hypothetical protein ACXADY_19655 [Candidatus Hodarchaeales archaeon]